MQTQFKLSLAASFGLLLSTGPVDASQQTAAAPYDIVASRWYNGQPSTGGFFKTDGTRQNDPETGGVPACATLPRWGFPLNTPEGQTIMATILTAKATGKTIFVQGTGACTSSGNSEDVQMVRLNN